MCAVWHKRNGFCAVRGIEDILVNLVSHRLITNKLTLSSCKVKNNFLIFSLEWWDISHEDYISILYRI